ncbi:glycosyltransferase family 39 protein [Chloroflexus sp.]|uniref:glycosyltransferase family 39 protein n=1 Tax=Chloroflexus sp. TaxID=1904827 RepID=UPI002ACDDCAB|nr:glycosyltransferase family 39 protein [Chloroflexus sp.]
MEYSPTQPIVIEPPRWWRIKLAQAVRQPSVIIGVLIVIGLALRLWFIAINQIDPRFSAADDGDYYVRALRFAVTSEYVDNSWLVRPPGHIFFFAAMLRIGLWFGDPAIGIALIRAVQVILSLALIPLGYDLARRLFDQRTGLIFAAILAVWMPMVELPALILSEPLFFTMLVIHAWLLVRWRDDRRLRWLIGAGVTLAFAALARSPGLDGAAFAVLFIAISPWRAADQR